MTTQANRVWDPSSYLRFEGERLRPAVDLLGRIPNERVESVVDLGCGTGNMAPHFRRRWPGATLYLVDASPEMLDRARRDLTPTATAVAAGLPETHFIHASFGQLAQHLPHRVDVIFSNAALHWVSGAEHATLLPRYLRELLNQGGSLAMQMPDTRNQPSHEMMRVAGKLLGLTELDGVRQTTAELSPKFYHRMLRQHCARLNMWHTVYCHELYGDNPVAEFFASSGLGPYVEALKSDEDKRRAFVAKYRELVAQAYPKEPTDMATLLFMKRLFLVATLAESGEK